MDVSCCADDGSPALRLLGTLGAQPCCFSPLCGSPKEQSFQIVCRHTWWDLHYLCDLPFLLVLSLSHCILALSSLALLQYLIPRDRSLSFLHQCQYLGTSLASLKLSTPKSLEVLLSPCSASVCQVGLSKTYFSRGFCNRFLPFSPGLANESGLPVVSLPLRLEAL